MKSLPCKTLAAMALTLTLAASAAASVQDTPAAGGDGLAAAREQLEQGRPKQAVELLQELLGAADAQDAGGAPARAIRLLLTEAQIAAGDARQAVETITPLAEGGDYEVLLATGRTYKAWAEQMEREEARDDDIGFAFDEARSYLEQAAGKAARGESAAGIELGNFELYKLHDHEAALGRAETLLEADAKDAEARLLKGCALLWASIRAAESDEQEAAALRKTAIADLVAAEKALPKTRPEAWVQLAWLYEADGQPEQAVEAAIKALERTPKGGVGTLFHLTLRYAGERRYPISATALAAMIEHDARQVTDAIRAESDPTAAALALTYSTMPMLEARAATEARNALAAIVAARPQHVDPWNNYALVCRDTQQYEQAYEAYEQALTFQPDSPRLMNDTGLILHYYLHRDYDRAQELYEQAVEQADSLLAAKDLSDDQRAELNSARADAVGNLKQLAQGDYTWP